MNCSTRRPVLTLSYRFQANVEWPFVVFTSEVQILYRLHFSAAVITKEHLYTIVMKTGSTDICLSMLVTNVYLRCNANVGVGKKCNVEPILTTIQKDHIRKYTDNS